MIGRESQVYTGVRGEQQLERARVRAIADFDGQVVSHSSVTRSFLQGIRDAAVFVEVLVVDGWARRTLLKHAVTAGLYTAHERVEPCLDFRCRNRIAASGWVRAVAAVDVPRTPMNRSTVHVKTAKLVQLQLPPMSVPPLLVASFDIERYSQTGDFPKATNREDRITMIGVHLSRAHDASHSRVLMFTSMPCAPLEGAELRASASEREMLGDFIAHMGRLHPEVLEVATYCVRDVELPFRLMHSLSLLLNKLAESETVNTTLSDLVTHGQGIKIFSYIAQLARWLGRGSCLPTGMEDQLGPVARAGLLAELRSRVHYLNSGLAASLLNDDAPPDALVAEIAQLSDVLASDPSALAALLLKGGRSAQGLTMEELPAELEFELVTDILDAELVLIRAPPYCPNCLPEQRVPLLPLPDASMILPGGLSLAIAPPDAPLFSPALLELHRAFVFNGLALLVNLADVASDQSAVARGGLLDLLVELLASTDPSLTYYGAVGIQNLMALLRAGGEPLVDTLRVSSVQPIAEAAAGAHHNVRRLLRQLTMLDVADLLLPDDDDPLTVAAAKATAADEARFDATGYTH
ncbi:DNA polymerase family B, exonuclease domain-containing protein, partial [Pavlovales sp. CCMP2436]